MPPPGEHAAGARCTVELRDLHLGWALRSRSRGAVGFAAERLNQLQFLTIRALSDAWCSARWWCCSWCSRYGNDRSTLWCSCAQMTLVLALAPLLTGYVRKVKAHLLRRQGPPLLQPYRDLLRLLRKEVVLADTASWLFRVAPYLIFAATWVAAALVPTFATGLCSASRRPDRHRRAARQRAFLARAGRARRRHQLRRHRRRAAR